jgi:hypothetical protein
MGTNCEDVYLGFECKRLQVTRKRKMYPLVGEYVSSGMIRWIEERYGPTHFQGGMIAYVLDGDADGAVRRVDAHIRGKREGLKMASSGLAKSSARRQEDCIRETIHQLGDRQFLMHHVFLAC